MANGTQSAAVKTAPAPASDEGWQDYKPAEQGWQDYTQGGQAGAQPIQDKSSISAPQPRTLMDDISTWWHKRPEYGGTLSGPGKSPRDIGIEAAKGAAFGAGGSAVLGFPALRGIAGMIAGGKLAEAIGIPEWIGAIGGGSLAGHGELPTRFGGGKGRPAPEPVEEPPFPRGSTSSAPGSIKDEIAASTRASEGTRTLRGDMGDRGPTSTSAPETPKYPLRNRYQRAAQEKRAAQESTSFTRPAPSTAPSGEASPVPRKGRNLQTGGPDWTEEVRRRAPGVSPEQKSLRRQMEKERSSGPTPGQIQRGEAAVKGMTTRTKRKVEDAESRRQAKRGAAASENE